MPPMPVTAILPPCRIASVNCGRHEAASMTYSSFDSPCRHNSQLRPVIDSGTRRPNVTCDESRYSACAECSCAWQKSSSSRLPISGP